MQNLRVARIFSVLFLISISVNQTYAQRAFAPEKPKLVVGIVVEQMKYEYINRYWENFTAAGFRKLVYEGTNCKNTHYNYMFTQSTAGMATIATGTEPSEHGIVADMWYNRLSEKRIHAEKDNVAKPIGTHSDLAKCSPRNLVVSTLGDELKLSNFNRSKVFAVSLRNSSAVFLGGHTANAAYWFDNKTGNWVSSNHYLEALPEWVSGFNAKQYPTMYLERDWSTLMPMERYQKSFADNSPYEDGFGRGRNTFPHPMARYHKQAGDFRTLRYSPFGNSLTKDFAIATIVNEEMGSDGETDYLTVSFSVNHYISEKFGPGSVELADTYLRLDQDIAHFLSFLDEQFGKKNVLVYLTSNQGAIMSPDYLQDIGMPAGYFKNGSAISLLKAYLKALYGRGDWVKYYTEHQIYLNRILIEDSRIPLAEIQAQVAEFMVQFKGVANAQTSESMKNSNFTDGVFNKFRNSYNQKRSGDVLLNLDPGWVQMTESTKHSSAYTYDTHVPLVWWGWKIRRKTVSRKVNITDIAPTIADFLNISFPNAASGQPIIELVD